MTNSCGCEHEDINVETASNRLNGVADPEGATLPLLISLFLISLSPCLSLSLGESLATMCNKKKLLKREKEKYRKRYKKIQKNTERNTYDK